MVSVYTFLAFLFLTSGALAKKCGEPGSETHLYCGYVLEQQPDKFPKNFLEKSIPAGISVQGNVENVRFSCDSGGSISYVDYCRNGCIPSMNGDGDDLCSVSAFTSCLESGYEQFRY
ncbi:hypothetical protein BDV29DRAFT_157742 [Aspergillus leporis]|uniref:Uncharacterized protein n=1 Tax=Aspergillus leporis TaxID=41062 RepID=A0A5N5X1Q0_9EURO|nr:hypothetical protein BDV29DRAFT_157742 [Aspergillus leporis]